jgi:hypothetical protein
MTIDEALVGDIAVDYWRLLKAYESLAAAAPEDRRARSSSQLRFATGRLTSLLERAGLALVVFDGRDYDPGLPASAINADEVAGAATLRIDQTIEPAIVAEGRVVRFGKIILAAGD